MTIENTIAAKNGVAARSYAPGSVAEVAALAYPVMLQTIAETAMHVIDSAMVGRLGATQLGAIGFAGIWVFTLLCPFAGLASGVQIFVSRHDGAGESERSGRWVWQALWLALPVLLVWSCLVLWCLPALFELIAPPATLRQLALEYAQTRLLGGPALVIDFALGAFFRGLGDPRTPLRAALVGIIANTCCGWVLIFGKLGAPALGLNGAALAQCIGSYTIAAGLLYRFLQRSCRQQYRTLPCWPERDAIVRYAKTAGPVSGQWLLDMSSFAIFTSIVARMGAASMAASQAMLQMLSISYMQAMALSSAAGTLIGRYIGRGDPAAASRSYGSSQRLALGLSAAVATLFLSVPEQLIGLFSTEDEVLRLARPLLALGALFQLVDAMTIVTSGSLRGAGDTRWPFAAQASLAWLLRLPAVYVGAIVLGGGVFGAWAGELVYLCVLGLTLILRFQAGHWRDIRI